MLSTDDFKYLDSKFDNVYNKIDNSMWNHTNNPCKNVQGHEDKKHKAVTVLGVILIIILVLGGIYTTFQLIGVR